MEGLFTRPFPENSSSRPDYLMYQRLVIYYLSGTGNALVLPLSRFKPFDLVFARFSPTSLRFWRRYLAPGIGVKDFGRKGKAK
jgi:hypothetical protein